MEPNSQIILEQRDATTDHLSTIKYNKDNKIPKYLLYDKIIYISIISFTIFSVISISLTQISVAIGMLFWLMKLYRTKSLRQMQLPIVMPIALFLLACIISIFASVNVYSSVIYSRKLLEITIFFFIINNVSQNDSLKLLKILICSMTIMSLYAICHAVVNGVSLEMRASGTMSIYMTFSGLLMLTNIMTISYLLFNVNKTNISKEWWIIIALLINMVSLFFTLSRNAWIGLLGGICFSFYFRKRVLLLLTPVLIAILLFISPDVIKHRMISIFDIHDPTNLERLSMWQSGINIIKDHLLVGCGLDCVKEIYPSYKTAESSINNPGHLHNNILQITAQTGLVGLVAWISIWVIYFSKISTLLKVVDKEDLLTRAIIVGSLSVFVSFLCAGIFEYNFGDSEILMLLLFLLAIPFTINKRYIREAKLLIKVSDPNKAVYY